MFDAVNACSFVFYSFFFPFFKKKIICHIVRLIFEMGCKCVRVALVLEKGFTYPSIMSYNYFGMFIL